MYKFTLESLLNHRIYTEDRLQKEFAESKRILNDEKMQLRKFEIEKHECWTQLQQKQRKGQPAAEIRVYMNYIDKLSKNIGDQRQRVLAAQKTFGQKRLALIEAMKERKILEKLKGGEDFEKLARSKSIDPAAPQGGRLTMQDGSDWISRGTFETSFEFELFKIPKGEVGGPIKTQFGWHLLKVEDHRQPEARTFIQVRALIKRRLQEQKNIKLHKQVAEELKKKIPVVIK